MTAAAVAISRLAAALDVPDERLSFLADAPAADIDTFRRLVTGYFFDSTADGLGKILAAVRVLPAPVAAKVATHSDSVLMTAHLASVLDIPRAISVARRLRPEFLARAAAFLDLQRSAELIARLPMDMSLAVSRELATREDWLTLGSIIEVATDEQLTGCLQVLDPDALLHAARTVADPVALKRAAAVAAEPLATQLRDIAAAAVDEA
ncbi:hypothetical protein ACFVAV_33645 [Nocardia sp. NPDC057663]|uniref:hypothetical protein n=1 Tax=Nocardia sp. NPDC057663 TaxID=3346201 RepID=UPI00366B5F3C